MSSYAQDLDCHFHCGHGQWLHLHALASRWQFLAGDFLMQRQAAMQSPWSPWRLKAWWCWLLGCRCTFPVCTMALCTGLLLDSQGASKASMANFQDGVTCPHLVNSPSLQGVKLSTIFWIQRTQFLRILTGCCSKSLSTRKQLCTGRSELCRRMRHAHTHTHTDILANNFTKRCTLAPLPCLFSMADFEVP